MRLRPGAVTAQRSSAERTSNNSRIQPYHDHPLHVPVRMSKQEGPNGRTYGKVSFQAADNKYRQYRQALIDSPSSNNSKRIVWQNGNEFTGSSAFDKAPILATTQRSENVSKFASLKTAPLNQYTSQILGGTRVTLEQQESTFRGTNIQILESQTAGGSLEREDSSSSKAFPPVHAQSLYQRRFVIK